MHAADSSYIRITVDISITWHGVVTVYVPIFTLECDVVKLEEIAIVSGVWSVHSEGFRGFPGLFTHTSEHVRFCFLVFFSFFSTFCIVFSSVR